MERARAWASVVFPEPGRPVTTMSFGVFIMLVRSLTASVGHDNGAETDPQTGTVLFWGMFGILDHVEHNLTT